MNDAIDIRFVKCRQHAVLPTKGTEHSAGYDLHANLNVVGGALIAPRSNLTIRTGLKIQLPRGFEGQIRSRSSLARLHNIVVLNSPGTIDADYTGEVKVLLRNVGDVPFTVCSHMKIAQLVIGRHWDIRWTETKELDPTARGEGGFGSTGVYYVSN